MARRRNPDSFRDSSSERKYPPWRFTSASTLSWMHRSVTMDCSEAQMVPLSKVLESKMCFTARGMSAVFSM